MGKIYLIRHAQSEGNLYRRALGWYDGPVSLLGRQQIAALAERFRDIPVDAVYSSDLLRAQETAKAISLPKDLETCLEPAFREIHLGEFTNIPYGEFRYHHPRLYEAFFSYSPQWAPGEGESFRQVAHRVTPAFFRLAEQHRKEHIAIVSHAMA
ncbi:MAG: histidine phosphatase family protein, partial [Oscillospiraceae bacterium]|nr:histidine phosphatase family protein [Oscillospiraceae bacterium]